MNRLAVIAKRYSYAATAVLLGATMLLPVIISGSAGAEQITERSVTASTSASAGTSVEYTIAFTATSAVIGGVVVDFCQGTTGPLAGTACTSWGGTIPATPTVSVTGHASTWTATGSGSVLTITTTSPAAPSGPMEFTVEGLTNPTLGGSEYHRTVYPRIFTYANATNAGAYDDEAPGASVIDSGSAAFAIVREIDVTAIVRETLTFCVAGASIEDNCGDGVEVAPSLKLGADSGDGETFIIDDSDLYVGNVYYQLSTNAANGTDINIKGEYADLRSGSNVIAGLATRGTIAAGEEKFGVAVNPGAVAGPEDGTDLTVGANFGQANVNKLLSEYAMPAAVTTTYGDTVAQASGPVRNANGSLVFGVSAAANTKAGIYTAKYNLIATPSY